jgi:hypothetical protein
VAPGRSDDRILNAYEISNELQYLDDALMSWQFVKDLLLDRENGNGFGLYMKTAVLCSTRIKQVSGNALTITRGLV